MKSIFRVLRKLFARHIPLHLLVPLLVATVVELIYVFYTHVEVKQHFLGPDRIIALLALIASYWVIAVYRISRETSVHFKMLQLALLRDELRTAAEYFAVSTFRLKDWFQPYAQAYLANVVSRRYDYANFRYERVFFFFTNGEWEDAHSHYLDGNFVIALRDIHQQHKIPMGFFTRADILGLIDKLSLAERRSLHLYPSTIRWLPEAILKWYPLRLRRRFPEFDFAFVRHTDGTKTALPFKKEGPIFKIEWKSDPATVGLYEKLMNRIRDVLLDGTGCIQPKYDFARLHVE